MLDILVQSRGNAKAATRFFRQLLTGVRSVPVPCQNLIDVAKPCRHVPGDHWFVDETYVKIAGRWVYLYRAINQYGQVIDVLAAEKRNLAATRRFFTRTLKHAPCPVEVTTHCQPPPGAAARYPHSRLVDAYGS